MKKIFVQTLTVLYLVVSLFSPIFAKDFCEHKLEIISLENVIYDNDTYRKIVYLDNINDPGNLGTILRTAVAFNYDAVILSKSSVDIYNEKVVAASKGALFLVDTYYDDIDNYLEGRKVIVSALDDATPLSECPKENNFILVLGNESHGVSPEIIKKANKVVKIEMNDSIDSLNVAVAAGILMNYYK